LLSNSLTKVIFRQPAAELAAAVLAPS